MWPSGLALPHSGGYLSVAKGFPSSPLGLTGSVGNVSVLLSDRLVGLVVKASASRAEDPGFESRLRRDFFGVESYQ